MLFAVQREPLLRALLPHVQQPGPGAVAVRPLPDRGSQWSGHPGVAGAAQSGSLQPRHCRHCLRPVLYLSRSRVRRQLWHFTGIYFLF